VSDETERSTLRWWQYIGPWPIRALPLSIITAFLFSFTVLGAAVLETQGIANFTGWVQVPSILLGTLVLWLVLEGYAAPDQILGLTFTTKAAGELLARTRHGLGAAAALDFLPGELVTSAAFEPSVSTYHSFAANLLSDHGIRLGLEPHAPVLAEGAREALALHVLRSTSLPLAALGSAPKTLLEAMLALDDELAELDITPRTLRQHSIDLIAALEAQGSSRQKIGDEMLTAARVRAALSGLVEEFRSAKSERQVMDFADQIRRAVDTLAEELAKIDPKFVR